MGPLRGLRREEADNCLRTLGRRGFGGHHLGRWGKGLIVDDGDDVAHPRNPHRLHPLPAYFHLGGYDDGGVVDPYRSRSN